MLRVPPLQPSLRPRRRRLDRQLMIPRLFLNYSELLVEILILIGVSKQRCFAIIHILRAKARTRLASARPAVH